MRAAIRQLTNRVGIDPFDMDRRRLGMLESEPHSRWAVGSPCRWLRPLDFLIHRVLPAMTQERFPRIAGFLARTSPRWGRLARPDLDHAPLGAPQNPSRCP